MNISIENKVVWFCPERTGGRLLREILINQSFYNCSKKNSYNLIPINESGISHQNEIPEPYQDFTLISNVRNPYDRVWSLYLNFYTKNFQPKELQLTKIKFNNYIQQSLVVTTQGILLDNFYGENNHFDKWRFTHKKPDVVVKLENIKEDISNLNFLNKELVPWEIFDGRFINHRPITFDTVYDWRSAQIIFQYYKNYFFDFGYDPFSFTNQQLTDQEKVNFIHEF